MDGADGRADVRLRLGEVGEAARRANLDLDAVSNIERDRDVLEVLDQHELRGNWRDLQRAAWRAVAARVAGDQRRLVVQAAIDGLEPPFSGGATARVDMPADLDAYLDAESRRIIEAALSASAGNKSEAAKRIGLPRKTFESRHRRLFG